MSDLKELLHQAIGDCCVRDGTIASWIVSPAQAEERIYGKIADAAKSRLPIGVSILLVNRDGHVALGERPANIAAGGFLSTPGGRIEEAEHLEETAARELEEETGIRLLPTQFKILGFKEHFRFTGHYFMIYVAAYYDGQLERKEPDKCLGWEWWKLGEIPADRCTEPPDILAMLAPMMPIPVGQHFLAVDEILPTLQLKNPCEIEVNLSDNRVTLRIDGRDHGWNRKTGEHTDAGTLNLEGL
jgi:8-oxo-dGTP diphosphatase